VQVEPLIRILPVSVRDTERREKERERKSQRERDRERKRLRESRENILYQLLGYFIQILA
jgi:hypothetical protein